MSKKEKPVMTMTVGDGMSYDPVEKMEEEPSDDSLVYVQETGEWVKYGELKKMRESEKKKSKSP